MPTFSYLIFYLDWYLEAEHGVLVLVDKLPSAGDLHGGVGVLYGQVHVVHQLLASLKRTVTAAEIFASLQGAAVEGQFHTRRNDANNLAGETLGGLGGHYGGLPSGGFSVVNLAGKPSATVHSDGLDGGTGTAVLYLDFVSKSIANGNSCKKNKIKKVHNNEGCCICSNCSRTIQNSVFSHFT